MNSGARFFLLSLVVIALLVFGIIFIIRGGSDRDTVVDTGVNLTELADEGRGTVEFNMEGPINAQEDHRTIRMTVNSNVRLIEIISGYEGQVISSQSYANNGEAYSEFLAALTRAGFNRERTRDDISSDAVCPTGNRTHYRVIDGDVKQNSWSASCVDGTFNGNVSLTQRLFQAQFPNYSQITSGISMGSSARNTGLVL